MEEKKDKHTWSRSAFSEKSLRLLEVALRWVVVGLPAVAEEIEQ